MDEHKSMLVSTPLIFPHIFSTILMHSCDLSRRTIRAAEIPSWEDFRASIAGEAVFQAVASEDDRKAAFDLVISDIRMATLVRWEWGVLRVQNTETV